MHKEGDHDVLTPDEARGAVTNHNVRYVLAFSLGAAIIVMSAAWMIASMGTDDAPAASKTGDPAVTGATAEPPQAPKQ